MLKVAIVLFDGVEELDFAGPYEVFGNVAEVFTVAVAPQVKGRHGLKVVPDYTFATAPQPDVLVVPGGPVTRENPGSLSDAVAYVRQVAPICRNVLSVCTGAFVLGQAGLLEGRHCTTHYRRRHLLMARYPDAHVHYTRVVHDGKFISTAGVAAGMDGALFLISRLVDMETARKVAKQIEYPWHSHHVYHAGQGAEEHEWQEAPAAW